MKRQLQAEGKKLSWLPKDITQLAEALQKERREEFIEKAKASSVVQEMRVKCERRAQRKAAKAKTSSVEAFGAAPELA